MSMSIPLGRKPKDCPGGGCRCTTVCGQAVIDGLDVSSLTGEAEAAGLRKALESIALSDGEGYPPDARELRTRAYRALWAESQ
jgi:hypothetical protein